MAQLCAVRYNTSRTDLSAKACIGDRMNTVKLLHIGDVHYPDAELERLADVKDLGFPAYLVESSNLKPLELVMRSLQTELESGFDGILVAGDLTSRGDLDGYKRCLEYLSSITESISPDRIHAVPGNHDIDRSAVDASGGGIDGKFEPFRAAWQAMGLPVLAVNRVRATDIASPTGAKVRVLSLNSSIGCGEKRHLPPEIADDLKSILGKFAATADPKDAFRLVGETLDTPAFQQADIDDACRDISASEKGAMPVVLSHHNLLPQSLPRVALYAELLNGGVARSRLLGLRRSILYCHGHLHDDPIEIVAEPSNPGSHVILISAPALTRGFNTITVEFGRKGWPLGCVVTIHRLSTRNGSVEPRTVRIPLYGPDLDIIRRLGNDLVESVLDVLSDGEVRFKDIQRSLRAKQQRVQAATLVEALLEAEWLGCVAVRNHEYDPQHWHVRRISR